MKGCATKKDMKHEMNKMKKEDKKQDMKDIKKKMPKGKK